MSYMSISAQPGLQARSRRSLLEGLFLHPPQKKTKCFPPRPERPAYIMYVFINECMELIPFWSPLYRVVVVQVRPPSALLLSILLPKPIKIQHLPKMLDEASQPFCSRRGPRGATRLDAPQQSVTNLSFHQLRSATMY